MLNEIEKKVRNELIKLAQKGSLLGEITYQDISDVCRLGLDMQDIDQRNQLGHILGNISRFEANEKRPMLSALVFNEQKNEPGSGFFELARELGKLKPWEDQTDFWSDELNRVYAEWSK